MQVGCFESIHDQEAVIVQVLMGNDELSQGEGRVSE